ncbi:MAG: hypothetical protein LM522_15270 [Candidatus Contendobacter sp.]|nr:hypothetical protein [Candidatus Contendobacter sp.]
MARRFGVLARFHQDFELFVGGLQVRADGFQSFREESILFGLAGPAAVFIVAVVGMCRWRRKMYCVERRSVGNNFLN